MVLPEVLSWATEIPAHTLQISGVVVNEYSQPFPHYSCKADALLFEPQVLDHPDAVSLTVFAVGLASTCTVLWVSSRRVDRKERERSQFIRMRTRLNQLMRERF